MARIIEEESKKLVIYRQEKEVLARMLIQLEALEEEEVLL